MLNTPLVSIICVLIASILGAGGQYLFKIGTDRVAGGPLSFLVSPWVLSGMVCYIVVMFFFTYAFKKGGTVTVLYPVYASTFIWAAVMGWLIYAQPIKPIHIFGMVLLLVGMYCMAVGNAAVKS